MHLSADGVKHLFFLVHQAVLFGLGQGNAGDESSEGTNARMTRRQEAGMAAAADAYARRRKAGMAVHGGDSSEATVITAALWILGITTVTGYLVLRSNTFATRLYAQWPTVSIGEGGSEVEQI